MKENMLTVQEVGCRIGVSVQTIGSWYKFKRENPNSKYSEMLPEFERCGGRNTRYWKESDLTMLVKFHETIPMGRNGVLGSVTQRYSKRVTGDKERKKHYHAKTEAGKYSSLIERTTSLYRNAGIEEETIEAILELLKSEIAWKMEQAG